MNGLSSPTAILVLGLLMAAAVVLVLARRPRGVPMDRPSVPALILGLIIVVGVAALLYTFFLQPPAEKTIPYGGSPTSFLGYVKQGQADRVVQQGTELTITMSGGQTTFTSQVPSELTNVLADIESACGEPDAKCVAGKPELAAEAPSQTGQILTLLLTALLPVILIAAVFYFMLRLARGGAGMGPRRSTQQRLEELEALHAKSLVTDEEYAAKRRAIIQEL